MTHKGGGGWLVEGSWVCRGQNGKNNRLAHYRYWVYETVIISHSCIHNVVIYPHINPLRENFFSRNINMYMHFLSFHYIGVTEVGETLSKVRLGCNYFIQSKSWLLMIWRRNEPDCQQQWYWPINIQCFSWIANEVTTLSTPNHWNEMIESNFVCCKTFRCRDIKCNLYVGKVNLYWYTLVRQSSIWFSQIEYIWCQSSIMELYSEVFNDSISH